MKFNVMRKNLSFSLLLFLGISLVTNKISAQQTAFVGKTLTTVQLIDPNDNPKAIPFLGEKIVVIFYTDPDVKDINDPLSEAIKAKNYPKDKYSGIGIANCKDSWIPNAGVRLKVRQKEKQFPGSIFVDENKR